MGQAANSYSQESKFQEIMDKMFFNIFNYEPDSSVYPFLKKYHPQFTVKRDSTGWSMYPDMPIPEHHPVINSFQFKRHPFFDAGFWGGQLDFLSHDTKDGEPFSLRDVQLWFFFDNKRDAQAAFDRLSNMFAKVSKTSKVFDHSGRQVAQYSEEDEIDVLNTVEFILTEDELRPGKHKLFFRIGALTYTEYTYGV